MSAARRHFLAFHLGLFPPLIDPSDRLPRRTVWALTSGFLVVALVALFIGPNTLSVLAEEQDQRAIYLSLLNREQAAAPPAPVARPSLRGASPQRPLRSLFSALFGQPAPAQRTTALAYAPFDGPHRAPARSRAPRLASASSAAGMGQSRRSVCVRLCDGFAFPIGDDTGENNAAGQTAACAGMCPGAATRLYVVPAGSDKIDDAVSLIDNAPYTALHTAFRYASSRDASCSCHPVDQALPESATPMRDFTLRPGDRVMTKAGFRVFMGAARWPYRESNFATLADAGLGRKEFASLSLLERMSRPGAGVGALAQRAKPQRSVAVAPAWPLAAIEGERRVRVVGPRIELSQSGDFAAPTP